LAETGFSRSLLNTCTYSITKAERAYVGGDGVFAVAVEYVRVVIVLATEGGSAAGERGSNVKGGGS
jgi:hypothetical protein